jgi:hypothetical protein
MARIAPKLSLNLRPVGDWKRALDATQPTAFERRLRAAIMRATYQEAAWARRQIVEGIKSQAPGGQAFKPHSGLTLLARRLQRFRGSKILIRSGELIKSVVVEPNGPSMACFVGLKRSARSRDGKRLANLGEIHEYGKKIAVTPKMRAYFRAVFHVSLKPSTRYIVIPARPFLRPVFAQHYRTRREVQERIMERVVDAAMGLLGR